MRTSLPRCTILILASLWAGCDSSSPSDQRMVQVQGAVLEAGAVPNPPVDVDIRLWPVPGFEEGDSAAVFTDEAGRYSAELGPIGDGGVDSLQVVAIQSDCTQETFTEIQLTETNLGDGGTLEVPTLALSRTLPFPQTAVGTSMCAAIAGRALFGDLAGFSRLAMWIEESSDSIRGRWRLNHQVSVGDDAGSFSGAEEADRLVFLLRPTTPSPCVGLRVEMPFPTPPEPQLGLARVTSEGHCNVPDATIRFFHNTAELEP
jgi:hypothetical protein